MLAIVAGSDNYSEQELRMNNILKSNAKIYNQGGYSNVANLTVDTLRLLTMIMQARKQEYL